MRSSRRSALVSSIALLVILVSALASGGTGAAPAPNDPLAADLDHWLTVTQSRPDSDPLWAHLKETREPKLERAREDLRGGWRLAALQGLSMARPELAAAVYLNERPAGERNDMAAFEAAWKQTGEALRDDLGAPSPARFEGLPAFVRALSEATFPQVRAYYQASLDYAHNTTPGDGFLYLGAALARRDLVEFFRTLPASAPRRTTPPLRSIRPELDALEDELHSVYRPPVSIDRHREFILASATLKEARELDAAGLRYGALLRYLQAAQQIALLRPAAPAPLAPGTLDRRLRELAARLSAKGVDHGIGQLFLETARSEAARSAPGTVSPEAASLVEDVLPRYFAALEPARPQPPRPEPQVTVTLVRWPYT